MDDLRRELDRLRQALADREPVQLRMSYLARPDTSRPVWQGTTVPVIGAREITVRESGLVVPISTTPGPAPIDAMSVFLTAKEVLQRPITAEDVMKALRSNTTADLLFTAAYWLAPLEANGTSDNDLQLRAASMFFQDTPDAPVLTRVRNLIGNGYRLLAPQVLMAVMKAALLVSPRGPLSEEIRGFAPLVTAMLGMAQTLGAGTDDGPKWGGFPERLSLELVRNQYFNVDHNVGSLLARYQRLWHEIPAGLAKERGAINFVDTFKQVTGVRLDDLWLTATPLVGAATEGRIRFLADYLAQIPLPPATREGALRLLAIDVDEMRALVDAETKASGFDWAYTSFRHYPLVRLEDGSLLLLSLKFLQERTLGGAAYWELDRHYAAQGEAAFQRFRKFYAKVVEQYVRESLQHIVPQARAGARRLFDEQDQWKAWGTKKAKPKACDFLIDYGTAWVAIEVVSGRLTQESISGGTSSDFNRDVRKLVEEKALQLDSTIRNLDRNEKALTGRPRTSGRKIYPIVLVAHGFPVNPTTMTIIHERINDVGLLKGRNVAKLEIIDLDNLEQIEAFLEDGGLSFPELLADKQSANLRLTAFDQYLSFERGVLLRRPSRIGDFAKNVIRRILREAGIER